MPSWLYTITNTILATLYFSVHETILLDYLRTLTHCIVNSQSILAIPSRYKGRDGFYSGQLRGYSLVCVCGGGGGGGGGGSQKT